MIVVSARKGLANTAQTARTDKTVSARQRNIFIGVLMNLMKKTGLFLKL